MRLQNLNQIGFVSLAATLALPAMVGAGYLGPERILFTAGKHSPNGKPLLVVVADGSTTAVYEISKVTANN
jgi:hypothetical protein